MIAQLTGRVDALSDGTCVIDVGGVGYLVQASSRTLSALPPPPDTAPPATPAPAGAPARPKTRFAYTGLDTFKATTFSRDGQPLGWTMRREGLGWKLVGIELPPS